MRAKGLLLVCLLVTTVAAADPVDCGRHASAQIERGAHLAQLLCGACHVVAHDQEFPPYLKQPAPSFFEIAARPDVNERNLRRFLASTHWDEKTIPMRMPNPLLNAEETSALLRYILCLNSAAH